MKNLITKLGYGVANFSTLKKIH